MQDKFCLIVSAFKPARIKRFVSTILGKDLGYPYDIFFVHNKFETKVKNRELRGPEEIAEMTEYLHSLAKEHAHISFIERENIGEDIGAARVGYLLNRSLYKYCYIICEKAIVKREGWLKEYHDLFTANPKLGLITPHIGRGSHDNPYDIKSSYFCIRNEVDMTDWVEPKCRIEAGQTEVRYLYSKLKSLGFNLMQYGSGNDHVVYLDDAWRESHQMFLISHESFTI